ncbi:MAG TPA: glycine cleavage system protein GcvH [Acetobacteraceae bacterium]|jgi:glycine cleavage system H protein
MPSKSSDKRYTKEHEWVALDGDIATVGITGHAQEQLGDVVFVELPEQGREVTAGEACAVVESVKAASDLFAPLAGKVVETNSAIIDDPALVNSDAEGQGWFFRLEIDGTAAFKALLDEDAYNEYLETLD